MRPTHQRRNLFPSQQPNQLRKTDMASQNKSSKASGKKAQTKIRDLKPSKDAKGGARRGAAAAGFRRVAAH